MPPIYQGSTSREQTFDPRSKWALVPEFFAPGTRGGSPPGVKPVSVLVEQGRVANSACARYAHARSGRRRTRNAATATLCEEEIYTCRIRAHDDDGDQANCAEKLAATQPLIVTTQ
jgi:hypothetical protein